MIIRLIRWSAAHPLAVLSATFLVALAGLAALHRIPIDAIPDVSDAQVIVYTEYSGQSAEIVEDQVTFPLSSALLTVPNARVVRGHSMQGTSFVYVILEEGADVDLARVRVEQQLSTLAGRLPAGVSPTLGPDATGVGWVFQYALTAKNRSLAELRTLQDWQVRYQLESTRGAAEVASVGGFVKTYSIVVNPQRLRALSISLTQLRDAVRASNQSIGARTIEMAETEIAIEGRGYLRNVDDIRNIVLRSDGGASVLVGDVARIELAPAERRGLADLNGEGEVVSGIAIKRIGVDVLSFIDAVKERLRTVKASLPSGVELKPIYDRSVLIESAIANLRSTLVDEAIAVAIVCAFFLMHARSAATAIVLLPISILVTMLLMWAFGITANIMSLGGLAIALGAMVDAALVMIENVHKRLESGQQLGSSSEAIVAAIVEVGPALFFSLLIITVSFLPVLTLGGEEGRLFKPLAFTKTFAMAAAALLSVTAVPALLVLVLRSGRLSSRLALSLNAWLVAHYRAIIERALDAKRLVIAASAGVLLLTIWPATRLGTEFMPPLNEGALFYMPTAAPGLSIAKAAELLQRQDRAIKAFPEVEAVLGKAGRAGTATDPAPMEMFETLIILKPVTAWRPGMTIEKLTRELDQALQIPGVSNSWTMPIRARIDMLATGIKTTLGVKIFGDDLAVLDALSSQISAAIRKVRGATSAYSDRVLGGRYLDIVPDRAALSRYGLRIADINSALALAVGAAPLTTTIEGRERYSVSLRYPQVMRNDPSSLARDLLVPLPGGKGAVPLGDLARLKLRMGPASVRSENGKPVVYVYVDFKDRDLASFVADARQAVREHVKLPPGYSMVWSGQYESLERASHRLGLVIPVTLVAIFLLLWACFGRLTEAAIVMLSLPFALVGGIWLMWGLGHHLSVASGVGFIALAGIAAQTGVVMLIYLDTALTGEARQAALQGRGLASSDLATAVINGAVERLRPKLMTVSAILAGLVPVIWSTGVGSDVLSRIAMPMIGGMLTSTVLTLLVIPVVYAIVKQPGLTSEIGSQAASCSWARRSQRVAARLFRWRQESV